MSGALVSLGDMIWYDIFRPWKTLNGRPYHDSRGYSKLQVGREIFPDLCVR